MAFGQITKIHRPLARGYGPGIDAGLSILALGSTGHAGIAVLIPAADRPDQGNPFAISPDPRSDLPPWPRPEPEQMPTATTAPGRDKTIGISSNSSFNRDTITLIVRFH